MDSFEDRQYLRIKRTIAISISLEKGRDGISRWGECLNPQYIPKFLGGKKNKQDSISVEFFLDSTPAFSLITFSSTK